MAVRNLPNEPNPKEGKGAWERGGKGEGLVPSAIFTKRTHALGAPVRGSEFKVQSFRKLRNEANGRWGDAVGIAKQFFNPYSSSS